MDNKKPSLIQIFLSFAYIGAITFGGGYAMLPFLERELVEKRKWLTLDENLNFYALGQCTPGIIAINVSTYIGYKKRGFKGAIASTFGMVFPSLIIISIISSLLITFDNIYLQRILYGIRISVFALLLSSIIKFSKKSIINKETLFIFSVSMILLFIFRIPTIFMIISSIVFGIVLSLFKINKDKNNE